MTVHASERFHHLEEIELSQEFYRYFEAFTGESHAFLLDSALVEAGSGQCSYIGANPFAVYEAKRIPSASDAPSRANIQLTQLTDSEGRVLAEPKVESRIGDLFSDLKETLNRFHVPSYGYSASPTPFLAGAVGYFSYETGYFIEALPDEGEDDLGLADVCLLFCDVVLAKNHDTQSTWLSIIGRGDTEAIARGRTERLRRQVLQKINAFERRPSPPWSGPGRGIEPREVRLNGHFDEERYCTAIREAQAHISRGDIFEVCLTHRMDTAFSGNAWTLYQELRRLNPSPFASFLKLPDAAIVSSSPERFIRLDHQGKVESRPIKGTRPRDENAVKDAQIREELANAIKDRAENMMIVDLVRNDLGRVCEFGSVQVPDLLKVEAYSTVFQLVSTVQGQLRPEFDAMDLIRAVAPGGSMTGAPKIEAMKIIDRLEPVKRGVYSGGIGYLDFSGNLDLSMVIRTLIVKDERAYINVGGAIVSDSEPSAEYQETMDKAKALIQALANLSGCGLA